MEQTGTNTYKDTGPEGHGDRRAQRHKDTGEKVIRVDRRTRQTRTTTYKETGQEGLGDKRVQIHIETRGQETWGQTDACVRGQTETAT